MNWFTMTPGRAEQRDILIGDVCSMRLVIDTDDYPSEMDRGTLSLLRELEAPMRREFEDAVHNTLGEEFGVRSLAIMRGSVEVMVVIATTYYAVSRYEAFRKSLDKLAADLKRIVSRTLDQQSASQQLPTVNGGWEPGPALLGLHGDDYAVDRTLAFAFRIMLIYLILSHAALLAFLISRSLY